MICCTFTTIWSWILCREWP